MIFSLLLGKGIYLSFYLSYLIFPLIFSLHIFFIFSPILYLFILPKVTPEGWEAKVGDPNIRDKEDQVGK